MAPLTLKFQVFNVKNKPNTESAYTFGSEATGLRSQVHLTQKANPNSHPFSFILHPFFHPSSFTLHPFFTFSHLSIQPLLQGSYFLSTDQNIIIWAVFEPDFQPAIGIGMNLGNGFNCRNVFSIESEKLLRIQYAL